jgi:hypothetical protein
LVADRGRLIPAAKRWQPRQAADIAAGTVRVAGVIHARDKLDSAEPWRLSRWWVAKGDQRSTMAGDGRGVMPAMSLSIARRCRQIKRA